MEAAAEEEEDREQKAATAEEERRQDPAVPVDQMVSTVVEQLSRIEQV